MTDQYVSAGTAAKRLGIHQNTVYRMIEEGKLKHLKVGQRYIIPEAELDEILIIREDGGKPTILRKDQIT